MKKTKLLSELRTSLEQALRANCHTKTVKIKICFDNTTIAIHGTVKSYYQKQMVLSIVKKFGQGVEIEDDVTVY